MIRTRPLGKITPGDDATVEALSPGDFTVTATWNGFSAEAEMTVYPGTQIPMGIMITIVDKGQIPATPWYMPSRTSRDDG